MRLKYHNEFMRRMLALFAFVNLFAGRASQQTSVWQASKSLALSLTFVLAGLALVYRLHHMRRFLVR